MHFEGDDISAIYRDIANALFIIGDDVTARGLRTKELLNVQIELNKPRNRFVNFAARNMDMNYCMGELCYFLDGRTDLDSIAHYSKFWIKVSDDGKTVNSAYGARIFGYRTPSKMPQFDYAIDVLRQDAQSRKAVIAIYNIGDARTSNDNPCTMFMQFVIRNNRLHCYTTMRSNDVWLGLPYDVAFFTTVHEIAYVKLLGTYPWLGLGTYIHNAVSLHVYDRNFEGLHEVRCESNHMPIVAPKISVIDVGSWFNDLLTYEKSKRGVVLYKNESYKTNFQDWCKQWLK